MQAGARAVFTSTEKYLTGLSATIRTNERRAGRIEGYRTLEGRLGKTRAATREGVPRPRGDGPQGSRAEGALAGERRSPVRGGYRSSASPGARGSSPGAASHNVRMGVA